MKSLDQVRSAGAHAPGNDTKVQNKFKFQGTILKRLMDFARSVPQLIDKIDISGKIVTADAMSMQKEVIDTIRGKGGDFLIELKANQRSLRYGVEDRLKEYAPLYSYTEGPELGHGRIEIRTYSIYDGLGIIADKEKWGGNLTIIEYESDTVKKSTSERTSEKRLYVSSLPTNTPALGKIVCDHWFIERFNEGIK